MRLTFLGTGTSVGVPMIGCGCAVCSSADSRNKRTRTSALIDAAGLRLLIDAGPDLRAQALRAGLTRLDGVMLTHHHADHVGGIDDLRPFCMHQGGSIPIYGSATTLHEVRARFAYAFDTTPSLSTRPALDLRSFDGPFSIGPVEVIPVEVLHGQSSITGYRIGSLGYVTDASALPSRTLDQLRGLDVLVLNALRYRSHPLHFTLDQALEQVALLRPRRAFLVHIAHDLDHATVSTHLPESVVLAYDGLSIEV